MEKGVVQAPLKLKVKIKEIHNNIIKSMLIKPKNIKNLHIVYYQTLYKFRKIIKIMSK